MSISDRPYKTILKRNVNRLKDADARETNIIASCIMAEVIRTTFGPLGMDKMIIDPVDEIIITNDGATIVKNFDVRHPMAKLLDMCVRAQDDEAGDGTKTVIIYIGELLRKALELMDNKISPSIIISGYEKAAEYACHLLEDNIVKIDPNDDTILRQIARTAMLGKTIGAVELFTDIALKAVRQVSEIENETTKVNIKKIAILAKQGESLLESELIQGMAIDKEVSREDMPKKIMHPKIAIIGPSIESQKPKLDSKISIQNPLLMRDFKAKERQIIRDTIDKIIKLGANVILSRRDFNEEAQIYLSLNNILAAQFVRGWDLEKIADAIGAQLITDFEDIKPEYLGTAEVVEEVKIGKDKVIFVRGCTDPKALCILIRGGTEHIVYEAERRMNDVLCVLRNTIEDKKILVGGGALEMELALQIKNWANKFSGKEQLAIKAYAEAFEVIPRTLIENTGLDPIDYLAALRQSQVTETQGKWFGFDATTKKICNMYDLGIYDSYRVKLHAIKAADEITRQILNIDDVIHAKPGEYETPADEEDI
ncbi:MAG TPA: thermosome subunit alpha [Candidatus Deferrimicrobium sp.]|nr:thermosome subunit alpha [Candidatus Deferrimicrobium sp.]